MSTNYRGFSLIELMVVVSLFGLAASLVTASYLSFERNQRIKNSALTLKNDLRLVANKATSGDKGPGGVCSNITSTLGGWYLLADFNAGLNTSYRIGGDCLTGSGEEVFYNTLGADKTVLLPKDTKINKIFYCAGDLNNPTAIFYRPLKSGVSFHNGTFAPPDFFEADGATLKNEFPPSELPDDSWVAIELSDTATTPSRFYWVKIEISGEVNESKTKPAGC